MKFFDAGKFCFEVQVTIFPGTETGLVFEKSFNIEVFEFL